MKTPITLLAMILISSIASSQADPEFGSDLARKLGADERGMKTLDADKKLRESLGRQ